MFVKHQATTFKLSIIIATQLIKIMGLIKGITIQTIESIQGGMAKFYTPQSSNQTMVVKVPANTVDDLYVHKHQTDQLLVVKGDFILVVLYNRQYQYIHLSDRFPQVVKIPKGVSHGAINFSDCDCLLVNAVLHHGEPNHRDYQPIAKPFPYDLEQAKSCLTSSREQSPTLIAGAGI